MMVLPWSKSDDNKIFINYRRDDAAGFAGRLSDTLAGYFGPDRVFRDVTNIDYGEDFENVIDEKVCQSGAMVVLIGEKWGTVTDDSGRRRLDDPADYVCREIVSALQSDIAVVPVLIGDASMPRPAELPECLADLARRNAISISDERWNHDVHRLAKVLAIDVAGSVAQRKLDLQMKVALLLLLVASIFVTIEFCAAAYTWARADGLAENALREAGFLPLKSAAPFLAILLAGTIALIAAPSMEAHKRKFAWAATALAYAGSFAAFVYYAVNNVAMPSWSLVVNFGAATTITTSVLVLICLAAFRAE